MLQTITSKDFEQLLAGQLGKYFIGRWDYYKVVIDLAKRECPTSVIEIGPGQHTIVKNCDIMVKPVDDAWGKPVNPVGKIYQHDATEKPWPIADKQYDLLIALQVWEHLDHKQTRAFREVMRTSKAAILSFPYQWDCPKDNANYPQHHQIDEELIGDWTLNIPPVETVKIPRTGPEVSKGPRIIYFWRFQ